MIEWLKKWLYPKPEKSTLRLRQIIYDNENYLNDDYINGRFIESVEYYEHLEHKDSFQYSLSQVTLITFSALTTFFVGLEAIIVASGAIKIIALLLTLFVAILGNFLTTFSFQAKWGAYRLIRESLVSEFYKFHLRNDPYSACKDSEECKKKFAARVEEIIEGANKVWEGLHSVGNH